MIEFSQLLAQHIHSKNIKTYALAQYCGIDRANMYKIIKGQRKPPSIEAVEKMCNFMQLTPLEKQELEEAYEITLAGQDNYYRRKNVLNFFSGFTLSSDSLNSLNYNFESDTNNGKLILLNGKTEIDCALLHIITLESSKDCGHIRLLIQPESNFLISVLAAQGHADSALKIEHIFCLNNNKETAYTQENYNLNCLKYILPLYSYSFQYTPYYYYDNIISKLGSFTLFPYMIVTTEYACIVTSDLQRGILTQDPAGIKMLGDIFDEYLSKSAPLLKRMDNIFTQLEYISALTASGRLGYSFQMTPCLTFFMKQEILDRYIRNDVLNRSSFIQKFLEYIDNVNTLQAENPIVFIFSLEGVRHFLQTGRISEYPESVYDAIGMDDRIYLIKQLLASVKTKSYKMLKNNIGDIENEIYLYITPQSGSLMFPAPSGLNVNYLDIEESGLLFTFLDFCKNLSQDMFYTKEETIQLITSAILNAQKDGRMP